MYSQGIPPKKAPSGHSISQQDQLETSLDGNSLKPGTSSEPPRCSAASDPKSLKQPDMATTSRLATIHATSIQRGQTPGQNAYMPIPLGEIIPFTDHLVMDQPEATALRLEVPLAIDDRSKKGKKRKTGQIKEKNVAINVKLGAMNHLGGNPTRVAEVKELGFKSLQDWMNRLAQDMNANKDNMVLWKDEKTERYYLTYFTKDQQGQDIGHQFVLYRDSTQSTDETLEFNTITAFPIDQDGIQRDKNRYSNCTPFQTPTALNPPKTQTEPVTSQPSEVVSSESTSQAEPITTQSPVVDQPAGKPSEYKALAKLLQKYETELSKVLSFVHKEREALKKLGLYSIDLNQKPSNDQIKALYQEIVSKPYRESQFQFGVITGQLEALSIDIDKAIQTIEDKQKGSTSLKLGQAKSRWFKAMDTYGAMRQLKNETIFYLSHAFSNALNMCETSFELSNQTFDRLAQNHNAAMKQIKGIQNRINNIIENQDTERAASLLGELVKINQLDFEMSPTPEMMERMLEISSFGQLFLSDLSVENPVEKETNNTPKVLSSGLHMTTFSQFRALSIAMLAALNGVQHFSAQVPEWIAQDSAQADAVEKMLAQINDLKGQSQAWPKPKLSIEELGNKVKEYDRLVLKAQSQIARSIEQFVDEVMPALRRNGNQAAINEFEMMRHQIRAGATRLYSPTDIK